MELTGRYGYVFRPALNDYPNQISKVMKTYRTGVSEVHTYNTIKMQLIDSECQYYMGEPEVCTIDPKRIRGLGIAVKPPYAVLNYTDGGDNLKQILKPGVDGPAVLQNFLNIIKGIQLMHAHERYHLDIKPDNIVIGHGHGQYRFIDFGFAQYKTVKRSKIYAKGFDRVMKYAYPYWPLDVLLLCPLPVKPIHPGQVHTYLAAMKHCGYPLPEVQAYIPPKNGDITQVAKRVDLWSIGITLYDIWKVLPEGSTRDKLHRQVILKILHINDRMTADELFALYETFLAEMV